MRYRSLLVGECKSRLIIFNFRVVTNPTLEFDYPGTLIELIMELREPGEELSGIVRNLRVIPRAE